MSYQTVKEVDKAIADQKRKLAELEASKEKMVKDRQTQTEKIGRASCRERV